MGNDQRNWKPEFARSLINQGNQSFNLDNVEDCLVRFNEAQEIINSVDGNCCELEQAGLSYNFGLVHYKLGSYDISKKYFNDAFKFAMKISSKSSRQIHGSIDTATILNYLANIKLMEEKYDAAIKCYERSAYLRREVIVEGTTRISDKFTSNYVSLTGTLSNLALAHHKRKSHVKAINVIKAGLALIPDEGSTSFNRVLAKLHYQLGNIFLSQNMLQSANICFQKSLDIFIQLLESTRPTKSLQIEGEFGSIKLQLETGLERTRHGMGLVLAREGRLEEAIGLFQDVLRKKRSLQLRAVNKSGDPDIGKLLCDMARGELKSYNLRDARCNLDDAMKEFAMCQNISFQNDYLKEARRIERRIKSTEDESFHFLDNTSEVSDITPATQ